MAPPLLPTRGRWPVLPIILLLGCKPAPGPVIPAGAVPMTAEQVRPWVAVTEPDGKTITQFKWLFQDDRSSAGGNGATRIAAPDTLRFDGRGPLGSGRMAALVVGDQPVWAVPEETMEQIVPDYTLLWAMFGVTRLPDSRATIRGVEEGGIRTWEYALGRDTVIYARSTSKLFAEVRRSGRVFGRVETRFSAEGKPASSRLTVPEVPAQLDITFVSSSSVVTFPPETWVSPEP
jgi:hypothetical protein